MKFIGQKAQNSVNQSAQSTRGSLVQGSLLSRVRGLIGLLYIIFSHLRLNRDLLA